MKVKTKLREEWVAWLRVYGADKFYNAFVRIAQGAKSRCIYCGQDIYLDIVEGGGVPDWGADGDYGCHSVLAKGSHAPQKEGKRK